MFLWEIAYDVSVYQKCIFELKHQFKQSYHYVSNIEINEKKIFMVLLFIRCHASVFFKMLIEQKTSDFYQKWLKLHFLNMSFLGLAPMLHLGNTISRGPPLTMQNCYKFLHVSIRFSIWFCDYDTQHLKFGLVSSLIPISCDTFQFHL